VRIYREHMGSRGHNQSYGYDTDLEGGDEVSYRLTSKSWSVNNLS
jgi:hypothetical protein